jgi:hypothetical protein
VGFVDRALARYRQALVGLHSNLDGEPGELCGGDVLGRAGGLPGEEFEVVARLTVLRIAWRL